MDFELETERLRLRRFEPADLAELAALHGEPAVMRYIELGYRLRREFWAVVTRPRRRTPSWTAPSTYWARSGSWRPR